MKKFVALAALLIGGVYFVQHSTAPPSPPAPPSPHTVETTALPWLQLRQGVKAYTGDNGGGDDFLTVCPTAALYKKWSSSPNAVVPQCNDKARGVPVTIGSDEIIPERDVTDQVMAGMYTVFIKADDGSWFGWTGSFGLQPRILPNTKVVVRLPARSGTMSLFPNKTSTKGEIILHPGATLQILAQEPRTGRLYAQVTSNSPDIGKKGWIWPLGLHVSEGDSPLLFAPPPK
jgi:hypothetical protein